MYPVSLKHYIFIKLLRRPGDCRLRLTEPTGSWAPFKSTPFNPPNQISGKNPYFRTFLATYDSISAYHSLTPSAYMGTVKPWGRGSERAGERVSIFLETPNVFAKMTQNGSVNSHFVFPGRVSDFRLQTRGDESILLKAFGITSSSSLPIASSGNGGTAVGRGPQGVAWGLR